MESSLPGVFVVGDLTCRPVRQAVFAAAVAEQTYVCSHCGKEVKTTEAKETPSCCGVPMEKKG